ncbi:acyltransferase family protein [Cellulomonas rhizosphaerae]|uniref:acyltransferase family protein n=1 Tax=Cellulomonas rhizosphaerae TaxID=2293719 RepID=UPI0013146508|nr:acyltransferase family protein [Cellulomonas rhizosphaerae]
MSTAALDWPAVPAAHVRRARFRPDIEGLRAVAVGLVLVYHAGVRQLPGGFIGVDIFFVISGFLITGLLLREVESTGRLSLANFYARRAKRLLPATALVLIAAAAVTWLWLPQTQRGILGGDIVAAAFYVVNWRLADRSVDYLAEGVVPSPVQHFWSLAVEEQFYVVWPLVILLVLVAARRYRLPLRGALAVGVAAIGVPSLAYSIWKTGDDPAPAFFVTTTRMWELAIGGAVALGATHWSRLPAGVARLLVWAGLGSLLGAALLIDGDKAAWPGSLALVPVLATAAVIVGGSAAARPGVRLLGAPPLVWIGGLSYSLYLWHWPVLIAAEALWGEFGAKKGLVLVAASLIPAWLSHKLVETPVRLSPWVAARARRGLLIGAVCTAIGALAGALVVLPSLTSDSTAAPGDVVGAHVLEQGPDWFVNDPVSITPSPDQATRDVPVLYADHCQSPQGESKPRVCEYGDPAGTWTMALVGDSKAAQWHSALDTIAKRDHFKLITLIKGSCAFSDGAQLRPQGQSFPDCVEWNANAMDEVLAAKPAVVVTTQREYRALEDPDDPSSPFTSDAMVDALASRWQTLEDAGIGVVALAGNPGPPGVLYECVAENRHDVSQCSFPAKAPTAGVQARAAKLVDGAHVVNLNDVICPDGSCPGVMGNVLTYRSTSHLTKTFVDSLTDVLAERLEPALPTS